MPPEALLRPLSTDILGFLAPLLIALGAFFVGRYFNRFSLATRVVLVGFKVAAIFVVLALLFRALPRPAELVISYAGGVIIVLCWMILAVIGFSWSAPKVSPDFFARFGLVLMPVALIGIEAGGSLWFRFVDTEAWQNRPNPLMWEGRMVQSTNMTCLPACAAMLLYKYGLVVEGEKEEYDFTEGELAYLANTSFFGTDAHTMAQAMTQKIKREHPQARAISKRATFEEMVTLGAPFIAEVQFEKVGKHSVFVYKITQHVLEYIDPFLSDPVGEIPHLVFDKLWTGNAIVIEGLSPPPEKK